jgi:hypothetical protein
MGSVKRGQSSFSRDCTAGALGGRPFGTGVTRRLRAAAVLKTRTLTNLYNERPAWLDNAHRDLDAAVAAAYGWPADISEEDALSRLLALNLERSR